MDPPHIPAFRIPNSAFASSSRGFTYNIESDSASVTEEDGASGGYHPVSHTHHHHHHHHVHIDPRETRHHPTHHVPQPDFSFTRDPSPPSYEEAIYGVPPTSTPVAPGDRSRHSVSAALASAPHNSPWSFPLRSRQPSTGSLWEDGDDFSDIVTSPESDDIRSGANSRAIIDQPSPPRRSPIEIADIADTEDFLSEVSASPPISQLSLCSTGTTSTEREGRDRDEGSAIRHARREVREALLGIVRHLRQQETWYSADNAWEYLTERLCGHGRNAQREAEVLWEFAFQANPLAHFGSILCLDPAALQRMIDLPSLAQQNGSRSL